MQGIEKAAEEEEWEKCKKTKQILAVDYIDHRNIEQDTLQNDHYRRVVYTTPDGQMQVVLMSLEPRESIPFEVHPDTTQFIRVESGQGEVEVKSVTLNKQEVIRLEELHDGVSVVIPAGAMHEVRNTSSKKKLKLYSIYTPAEHARTRSDWRQPRHSPLANQSVFSVVPTEGDKRKRNTANDPFANIGKIAIETILNDKWQKTHSLQEIYNVAQASPAVDRVLEEMKRGNSVAQDLTDAEIKLWVDYPEDATEEQIAQAVRDFGKVYFFQRIVMYYLPKMKHLPSDLQTLVDEGKIQYIDGAWYQLLDRTVKWIQNTTLNVEPWWVQDARVDGDGLQLTPTVKNMSAFYYNTSMSKNGLYYPDPERNSVVNEMYNNRYVIEISITLRLFHVLDLARKQYTDSYMDDEEDDLIDADVFREALFSGDSGIYPNVYFYEKDREAWKEYLEEDPEGYQIDDIFETPGDYFPAVYIGYDVHVNMDWTFLTPELSAKIAEALADADGEES